MKNDNKAIYIRPEPGLKLYLLIINLFIVLNTI